MEVGSQPSTIGRPRGFCVDAALSAALDVFWSKGFEGASLSALTRAMGITRPSLYAAFGNKAALFRKALDLYDRDNARFFSEALQAPSARAVAERLLAGALDTHTSTKHPRGCLYVIHSVACGAEAEHARVEVASRRAAGEAAMLARFERARCEGDLPTGLEPADLVRYLTAILQGLAVQADSGVPREGLQRVVDTTLRLWPDPPEPFIENKEQP